MEETRRQQLASWLQKIDEVIASGPYQDNWESLVTHPTPRWYRDAKFGIFIHWGVYSVPAYCNEWYPRFMYKKDHEVFEHHRRTYGPQSAFGYKKFIPMFRAENFDPAAWAKLFRESGARYVMPVAEHHDGFQMYDSQLSDWTAAKMGPKRDVLGELKEAVQKEGLTFTASSHRIEHYWFMAGLRQCESDLQGDPEYGDLYWPAKEEPFEENGQNRVMGIRVDELFMQDWLVRCCELVEKYRPKVLYFDWWIQVEALKPYLKKFAAYYYNRAAAWGEEVTINYKNDAFALGAATQDIERGQLAQISPLFWQTCNSVAKNSWGYTVGNDYKDPNDIICDLVDIVSKNGCLLLNVGPRSDGTIPEEDASILRSIGKWLAVNGEGIYGTTYWRIPGEGPTAVPSGAFTDQQRGAYTAEDFRFTRKGSTLYAFAMRWPEDGVVRIRSLGAVSDAFNGVIRSVEILGYDGQVSWKRCESYLSVRAAELSCDAPVCLRIRID